MKFKIGDNVRITSTTGLNGLHGTVVEYKSHNNDSGVLNVYAIEVFDDMLYGGDTLYINESELALIEKPAPVDYSLLNWLEGVR